MADNFKIPSTLPSGDAGIDMHALERTVNSILVKLGVTAIVDPTDPTKRQAVDATYGAAVDPTRVAPGAATSAKQDAEIAGLAALLAALSGTLTVTGAVTTGGLTDTQLRNSAVPVSLASLPALAAGTNAIGKLAANSGVDIGDVDVASLPAGPGTANNPGTQVTVGTSTVTALAAFAARKGATLYSDPTVNTGQIWIALGAGAAITNFVLNPGDSAPLNQGSGAYAGIVTAIASIAGQKLHVMEW